MADDKSIFDAFSSNTQSQVSQITQSDSQLSQPILDTPKPASGGGSIFSAFNPSQSTQQNLSPDNSSTSSPEIEKPKSDSIFSAMQEAGINEARKPDIVEGGGEAYNPNDPWYKKLWNVANAPLFDQQTAKNWFGADVHSWGGLGEGFFDLLSGLTSPLQLALTIGTFGTGALWDAGGVAALKAAGMAEKEISTVVKGSELVSKAIRNGHDAQKVWQGLTASGFDTSVLSEGLEIVKNAGLTPDSILSTGVIRNAGQAALRKAGMDLGMADKVAHWTQFMIDGGFTANNAYAAAIAAPSVFDAIKDGDYETAKKLAVEAAGTGLFAALGAYQVISHAGELAPDAASKLGLRVKPSEENLKLIRHFENYDEDVAVNSEYQKQWAEKIRKKYSDLSKEDMQLGRFLHEAGDEKELIKWHNAIAEASNRNSDRISTGDIPEGIGVPMKAKGYTTNIVQAKDDYPIIKISDNGTDVGKVIVRNDTELGPKAFEISDISSYIDRQGYGTALTEEAAKYARSQGADNLISSTVLTPDGKALWENIMKQRPEAVTLDNGRYILDLNKPLEKYDTADFKDKISDQLLKNKQKDYIDSLLRNTDPKNITDTIKEFTTEIRNHFNETLEKGKKADVLSEGAQNYFTRIWKKPDNETVKGFRPVSNGSGFSTYTTMARKRIFDSTLEGILSGHELSDFDPVSLAAHNGNEFGRIIAARDALDNLRSAGTRASDGRPMVALSGAGHAMVDEDGTRIGTAVQPGRAQSVRIAGKIIDGLKDNIIKEAVGDKPAFTELDRLIKQGKITQYGTDRNTGEPLYAWTTHDYRDVDSSSFRGWKVVGQDSDGRPIYIESDLKAHPEAQEYLNRRLGKNDGIIAKTPGAKQLLAIGREAKGILLSASPFHWVQEGLRAVMTGISPFGRTNFDVDNPIHRLAARKGVWEGKDIRGAQAFQEGLAGHSKILEKVPGLRQMQDFLQTKLFDVYIPSLKLRSFEKLYESYQKAYPEWTLDKAADVAAADTNNRFGGIAYKRMGRAAGTMDAARIMALAPDWLESELRFMGSMFGEQGKITRRDTAKIALLMWGVARVANTVMTGNMHNEAPFGLAYKDESGREKIYSLRTLPTDMLHAVSDPGGFLAGRESPLIRAGIEASTGRDQYGRKLPEHGLFIDLLKNISPIGLQTPIRKLSGEDSGTTTSDDIVKAAGGTVFPYRTEAQKMAARIASDHSEQGAVDPDKMRRHQAVLHLEDQVRSGQAPMSTVHELVERGQLHVDEAKTIEKNIKETKGLDPDMARLYMHVSRLPMEDVIKVWDTADNTEKAMLAPLLIRKKNAYVKKAFRNMSPEERMSDKNYRWIRSSFPEQAPY